MMGCMSSAPKAVTAQSGPMTALTQLFSDAPDELKASSHLLSSALDGKVTTSSTAAEVHRTVPSDDPATRSWVTVYWLATGDVSVPRLKQPSL